MTAIFVDTSAWFPLADSSHPDQAPLAGALEKRIRQGAAIVTSNLVVAETHSLLLRRAGRDVALSFVRAVLQPPIVVEFCPPERQKAAVTRWLTPYHDQNLSLADAVSFTIMEQLGIREALTLDRHFATAGFVRVFEPTG